MSEKPANPPPAERAVTLSVVVPVFNEEGNVRAVYQRVRDVMAEVGADFEIIFVDDCSTDATAAIVSQLHADDERVKLLSFSRNFGHQIALTAGMDRAAGDAVITMDGDLQHPPELIAELVRRWREGYEVVYTTRRATPGRSPLQRLAARLSYPLFRRLTGLDLPANTADFRLVDRKVALSLRRMRERARFLRGLTRWVGYRSVSVEYEAGARAAGESKYGLARLLGLGVDGMVSFSTRPLYAAIYIGLVEALVGFGYGLFAIIARLFFDVTQPGWASVVVLLAVLAGIQMFLTGVIGLYVGKIFEEVKHRPLYLLRRQLGFSQAAGDETGEAFA